MREDRLLVRRNDMSDIGEIIARQPEDHTVWVEWPDGTITLESLADVEPFVPRRRKAA